MPQLQEVLKEHASNECLAEVRSKEAVKRCQILEDKVKEASKQSQHRLLEIGKKNQPEVLREVANGASKQVSQPEALDSHCNGNCESVKYVQENPQPVVWLTPEGGGERSTRWMNKEKGESSKEVDCCLKCENTATLMEANVGST